MQQTAGSLFQAALISQPCCSRPSRDSDLKAGWVPSSEDGGTRPGPRLVPFVVFLGGSGGTSVIGDVGESVLAEKIWLVKAP